eukprot:2111112-Rhodomonas_salina.3
MDTDPTLRLTVNIQRQPQSPRSSNARPHPQAQQSKGRGRLVGLRLPLTCSLAACASSGRSTLLVS